MKRDDAPTTKPPPFPRYEAPRPAAKRTPTIMGARLPQKPTPKAEPASEPEPLSIPIIEGTVLGVAPEKRTVTPPSFASPREEAAIEEMARSRGERVLRAPESRAPMPADDISPEVIATAKALRAGGAALGKWAVGAVVTVVLGGGGALVGSQASNPVPPAVLQCPADLEQLRADMKSIRDRVGSVERDVDEATIDRRAQARKHESLQSEVYELGKRVPKVNP